MRLIVLSFLALAVLPDTIGSSSNDVQNYHTRVSQVLEKIYGKWVIRGAHYSRFMDAQGIPPRG